MKRNISELICKTVKGFDDCRHPIAQLNCEHCKNGGYGGNKSCLKMSNDQCSNIRNLKIYLHL